MAAIVDVDNKVRDVHYFGFQYYRALKPIVWVLILCGLDLRYEFNISDKQQKPLLYKIFLIILTLTFLSTCFGLGIALSYLLICHYLPLNFICFCVNLFGYVFGVTFLRIIFIIKKSKLRGLFDTLTYACIEILGKTDNDQLVYKITRKFVKRSLITIGMMYMSLCFLWTLINDTNNLTPETIIRQIFDGQNQMSTLTISFLRLLMAAEAIILILFYTFFELFYLSSCVLIIDMFTKLQENVKISDQQLTALSKFSIYFQCRAVLNFIAGHQRMCCAVRQMDNLFKEAVVVWNVLDITNFIFSIRSMNLGNEEQNFDREAIILDILLIFIFVLRTFLAAGINEQVLWTLL